MFAENSCAGCEVPRSPWKDMSKLNTKDTSAVEKGSNFDIGCSSTFCETNLVDARIDALTPAILRWGPRGSN
jgi:hypothetical protein